MSRQKLDLTSSDTYLSPVVPSLTSKQPLRGCNKAQSRHSYYPYLPNSRYVVALHMRKLQDRYLRCTFSGLMVTFTSGLLANSSFSNYTVPGSGSPQRQAEELVNRVGVAAKNTFVARVLNAPQLLLHTRTALGGTHRRSHEETVFKLYDPNHVIRAYRQKETAHQASITMPVTAVEASAWASSEGLAFFPFSGLAAGASALAFRFGAIRCSRLYNLRLGSRLI